MLSSAEQPLHDGHSFVLCDARVSGFPIRHASTGFKVLFAYRDGETPARSERLAGCSCLADSEASVAACAEAAGLHGNETVEALQRLEDMASETCRKIAGGDNAGDTGSVLLVKAKRGGDLFVCEVAVMLLRHPVTGWAFLVGLHKDVTESHSVRDVLQAAASGVQQVQTLLGGLHKRLGRQDALLQHPNSVAYVQEAYDKVFRGFLTGLGSKGSGGEDKNDGSGGGGGGGKLKKGKTARSEVSAATTASGISQAKSSGSGRSSHRKQEKAAEKAEKSSSTAPAAASSSSTSTAPPAPTVLTLKVPSTPQEEAVVSDDSSLSEHLLELLEPAGGEDASPMHRRWGRSMGSRRPEMDLKRFQQKSLQQYRFPFALFDPSQSGLPAVVCSAPLSKIMGKPIHKGIMEGLTLHTLCQGFDESAKCRELCESAMQSSYFRSGEKNPGPLRRMGMAHNLAEGELVCVDPRTRPRECMVYLKQVELDERMYIAALWVRIPTSIEASALMEQLRPMVADAGRGQPTQENIQHLLAFLCLDERMDMLVQVLASHFWFSAPMRRQTCVCEQLP